MSRSADLGPLPLNWRDVGLSLSSLHGAAIALPDGTELNLQEVQATTTDADVAEAAEAATELSAVPPTGHHAIEKNAPMTKVTTITVPAGRLLRSGQLALHHDRDVLGSPCTILNLRHSDDASSSYHPSLIITETAAHNNTNLAWTTPRAGSNSSNSSSNSSSSNSNSVVTLLHAPADNSLEKYDTSHPDVARWISSVLRLLQSAVPPILIHCRSGKDRTGIIVAAVLLAIGVKPDMVRREYLLSGETEGRHIDLAIRGLVGVGGKVGGGTHRTGHSSSSSRLLWLRGVDVDRLRDTITGAGRGRGVVGGGGAGRSTPPKEEEDDNEEERRHKKELAYLRDQMHVWQRAARPILQYEEEEAVVAAGHKYGTTTIPKQWSSEQAQGSSSRPLLVAMIRANCRQIELLLSLMHGCCSITTTSTTTTTCTTPYRKRIPQAIARQGYLRKLLGEYTLAATCFERALNLLSSSSSSSNHGSHSPTTIPDDKSCREWESERTKCLQKLAETYNWHQPRDDDYDFSAENN